MFDDGTTGPRGVADAVEAEGKKLGVDFHPPCYVIRSGDKDFRSILGTIPKDVDGIYAGIWAPGRGADRQAAFRCRAECAWSALTACSSRWTTSRLRPAQR